MVAFAVVGIPMLMISQLTDLYYFLEHLFTWRTEKLSDQKISTISIEAFTTLEAMISKEILRIEKIDCKSPQVMRTISLVKAVREELQISKCIQYLIFGNFQSMKHFEHTTSMQREQRKESGEEGDIPNAELDFSQPLIRIKVFN